jgi:tRNA-guanine family transglycosylase
MVGATLISVHNLHTLIQLAAEMRQAILEGRFISFVEKYWAD